MIKFASKNIYVVTKYYHQWGNHKFCRQYLISFQSEQQTDDGKIIKIQTYSLLCNN